MSDITIEQEKFGELDDGREVTLFKIENENGMRVDITNYGGIIVRLMVSDINGQLDDVVLGFDDLEQYFDDPNYFGAVVGRYANRIADAEFELNGEIFDLDANEEQAGKPNCLHGGYKGFDSYLWTAEITELEGDKALKLTHLSEDGEGGFPGNLKAEVYYVLKANNKLHIEYRAESDKDTVVNLTNHSYFNLKGHGEDKITDHLIYINADYFTPVDEALIPTGEIREVEDTPFDFTAINELGKTIDADSEQLEITGGYDHNFVLNKGDEELSLAARVIETISGRKMEIYTTEPGVQFYTGNFIKANTSGKSNKKYKKRGGLCLETQHYPDSPNKDSFPSTVLKAGDKYRSVTEYVFNLM